MSSTRAAEDDFLALHHAPPRATIEPTSVHNNESPPTMNEPPPPNTIEPTSIHNNESPPAMNEASHPLTSFPLWYAFGS